MLPTLDDCNECKPAYLQRRRLDSAPSSVIALSLAPFIVTFLVVAVAVGRRIYPSLTSPSTTSKEQNSSEHGRNTSRKTLSKRFTPFVFSITIALSAVLVELILCEISDLLNPAARGLALRVTLCSLLVLIILVVPILEVHLLVSIFLRRSPEPGEGGRGSRIIHYLADVLCLMIWLFGFWYMPHVPALPSSHHNDSRKSLLDSGFIEACLERIGVIGISLMASLAGFAAVSSAWQTFGVRQRIVRETDIARKENGLVATREMLATKESRFRAVQHKISQAPTEKGYMTRFMGSLRGNAEQTEMRSLEMEISGLETMELMLSSALSTLQTKYAEQQRAHTALGRLLNAFNFGFALYCLYRIAATSFSFLRRWWQPETTFATSDPINNIIALLTTHYDPTLDREAWSRQISFALSGVMLFASFNAVLQTFRLFSRFFPGLIQHTQTSLPLIVSQIAGAYVISSALLLRSNLPSEVSNVITEALGAPLEGKFVESWFESWFLVTVGLTCMGILISRKTGSDGYEDWDDAGDLETGKMN